MTTPFFQPVHDLIVDAAINAIDGGRAKGFADHDTRQYFLTAAAEAFDAHVVQDDADPDAASPDAQP